MDDLDRFIRILLVNQYRYLNLAGGNHVDVDIGIVKRLKQRGCHPGIVDHARAHNRDLCNVRVGLKPRIADFILCSSRSPAALKRSDSATVKQMSLPSSWPMP